MRIVVFSGTTEGRDFSRAAARVGHCRYRQRSNRPGGRGTGPGPRHYRTFRSPAARRHGGAFAGRSPLCGCHPPLRGGSHQKHPRRRQRSRGRVPPPAARRQHLARGQCGAGQCRPGRAVFSRNAGQCSAHHRCQRACGLCRAGCRPLVPAGAAHRGGHYGVRGRGHPAPQHHCHAGALYAGTEPCADAAVPHPLPCHQGRRQRGRLCPEKAQAAAQSEATLVVLRRPEECGETAEEILQRCRELL